MTSLPMTAETASAEIPAVEILVHLLILQPEGLVRWADSWIADLDQPPHWLIAVSTTRTRRPEDLLRIMRAEPEPPHFELWLSTLIACYRHRRMLNIIGPISQGMMAHFDNFYNLPNEDDDQLAELLVDWDCQDDLDVTSEWHQADFIAVLDRLDAHRALLDDVFRRITRPSY